MPENGGNGLADLLTVDLLCATVQDALGRVQAARKSLEGLSAEAVKLGKRAQASVETCLRTLQDAESDLYVADHMAKALQPKPEDEGDRRLRRAILIAAGGGSGLLSGAPPTLRRRHRRPRRAFRRGTPDGTAA